MPAKKNYGTAQRSAREASARMSQDMACRPGATSDVHGSGTLPLRDHAQRALSDYFASLDGHHPARLYDLVIREVEEPLFRAVLVHCDGNQSLAAGMLGINRGTLRKKLREFGLSA